MALCKSIIQVNIQVVDAKVNYSSFEVSAIVLLVNDGSMDDMFALVCLHSRLRSMKEIDKIKSC